MAMEKAYQFKTVEKRWYEYWESKGFFECATGDESRETFCIAIPPPNVTSVLHMGHALNNSIQDVMIRFKRMQGFNTLWQPGTDHAGIATQNVVEKMLAKEGTNRHEQGRKKTVERIWDWVDHYGNAIVDQLKAIGCSADWKRSRFTLDEGLSRAVREVFVRLYEKGYIYRGERIINWCPRCMTALSDEESPKKDTPGKLYHIKYPIEGADSFLTVATTRPETMLGDTAIAVYPGDERYQHILDKTVILPLMNRPIQVIKDHYVDKEFGTGLVKVTPAHDPNDFAMGERHGLEQIVVMDEKGIMNENAGPYKGLDRFAARDKIVEDLKTQKLLETIEDHTHTVPHCDRCGTVVEPYLSEQWFVKMKEMAAPAIDVVKSGQVKFIPQRWARVYLDWMENIRDWCISRQLWWGHQIPVWYCKDCSEVIVVRDDPTACSKCGSEKLERDPDVLDTWFSSWLWPFSTLGWPDEHDPAFERFYPTNLLSTDRSIIFLWVARMVMAGLEFCGKIPFEYVNIHATILDDQGRKMSKSLGNGVDPLDLIEKYGADAMRFSLMSMTKEGQDIKFAEKKMEMGRNFTNKIWNATRFMLMHLEKAEGLGTLPSIERDEDKWILSRLNTTILEITGDLEEVGMHGYGQKMYQFFWNDLCDWYIEIVKNRLHDEKDLESRNQARQALYHVLENSLRLLHPMISGQFAQCYVQTLAFFLENGQPSLLFFYNGCISMGKKFLIAQFLLQRTNSSLFLCEIFFPTSFQRR